MCHAALRCAVLRWSGGGNDINNEARAAKSRMVKGECLRVLAQVGTLKPEAGFVAWLQLPGAEVSARML